ncbi:hypothetical protein Scep_025730 [Stephania cephalantha]|uniref:WRKY domain-containing protein n=1 Tax=Stephania cephalantha TaxID=152367 RepID=A0AAP0HRU7_9MAGN
MESSSVDWDQISLINEISQVRELVRELRNHVNPTSLNGEVLIEKTLSSLERALSMASTTSRFGVGEIAHPGVPSMGMLESPHSLSGSPHSDDNERGDESKKRKGMLKWSEQVNVGPGLDGPVDDGHSWRKYGQKDILGAKYPRGYYRCTYRSVQGCLATKQVQRSDENPLIFDITYRGRHTCMQSSHNPIPTTPQTSQNGEEDHKHKDQLEQYLKPRSESQEILLNFSSSGLESIKSENFDNVLQDPTYSFTFPSSSTEIHGFNGSSTLDDPYIVATNNFSPTFMSPTSASPSHMNNNNDGVGENFEIHESDLDEIVRVATSSSSNSLVVDRNFAFDALEMDPGFLFGNDWFSKLRK